MYDVVKVEPKTELDSAKDLCVESVRQYTKDLHPLSNSFVKIEPPDQVIEVTKLYVDHEVKQEMVIGPTLVQPSASDLRQQFSEISPEPVDQEIELKKLYVDHEVKPELAIGPTVVQLSASDLQQQHFCDESATSEEHVNTQSGEKCYKNKTRDEELHENHKNEISSSLVNTGTKRHVCSECDKAFKRKYDLKIHLRTHTGERPYKCEECGKEFVKPSTLRAHFIYSHTDSRSHVCTVCNKGFVSKSNLNIHSRVHTKEPYKCDACGKQFKYNKQYKQHVVLAHFIPAVFAKKSFDQTEA